MSPYSFALGLPCIGPLVLAPSGKKSDFSSAKMSKSIVTRETYLFGWGRKDLERQAVCWFADQPLPDHYP